MQTYKSHGFVWPNGQSHASAFHDPCCSHPWKQDQTHSTEPRQDHAHSGHPVAIVLPVSDGVNDLEVALQSDHNETELTGGDAERSECKAFKEQADCTVKNRVAVVAIAVCDHHDQRAHTTHGGE